LKFAGQDIELSKKGKQTDAVLLLKTLLKEQTSDWKHNDEILTDWGYTDADQKKVPKNKVYFAGQKINNAVALKAQIEDFVECNTSKARINPKYRKVDE
jgi:predicted RNA-binding Zn ribbon-like protein